MAYLHAKQTRMSMADDLLYGLDIEDGESREFLKSLIVSGLVPREVMKRLYEASLMQGAEEWYMLVNCATSIRNEAVSRAGLADGDEGDPGVVPYVAYVLSGKAAEDQARRSAEPRRRGGRPKSSSKRRRTGTVSRFWEDSPVVPVGVGPSTDVRRQQGPAHDVQDGGDGLGEAITPGSPPAKRKRRRKSSIMEEQSAESNCEVTMSRRRQDGPLPGTADPTLISSGDDPSLLLEIKIEDDGGMPWDIPAAIPRPKQLVTKSPYFSPQASPAKKARPRRGTISSLPIPPLSAPRFGLIQEELADDPFRLLVAVTLLIRTTGRAAIPAFRRLVDRFPTPASLAAAEPADVVGVIRHLGLSAVRCAALQRYAGLWAARPPTRDVRYGVKNYPRAGDGRGVTARGEYGPEAEDGDGDGGGEDNGDGDGDCDSADVPRREAPGSAWEIGHLTQGPYAIDSWRIFCRDVLLGRAEDWTGKGRESMFRPEWTRVLPADKELRACLRWMWMREGWEWDPVSGERVVLREEMRRAVDEGRVGYDDNGGLVILDQPLTESDAVG